MYIFVHGSFVVSLLVCYTHDLPCIKSGKYLYVLSILDNYKQLRIIHGSIGLPCCFLGQSLRFQDGWKLLVQLVHTLPVPHLVSYLYRAQSRQERVMVGLVTQPKCSVEMFPDKGRGVVLREPVAEGAYVVEYKADV